MHLLKAHQISFFLLSILLLPPPPSSFAGEGDVLDLDLESLMQIQITSAGRKVQKLADVPAAAYVINQDDIRNSGVTSLPEALRLVPGLQIARVSSNKWVVTSRGFNGLFANKLLVQIDGRTVYTPSFSGVYWDMQNVVLEDVDRIEVIRGPGSTLWGANAMNGIINIITKQSSDTQGILMSGAGGNHEELLATGRYGIQFDQDTYGRFYIQHHNQDSFTFLTDQTDAHDEWRMTNGGFRLDGDRGLDNSWTFQGDLYRGKVDQRVDTFYTATPPYLDRVRDQADTSGYNLLTRLEHRLSDTNSITAQMYYDYTNRDEVYLKQVNHTLDFDLTQHVQIGEAHDIVWGIGYRLNKDDFENTFQVAMTPDRKTTNLFSTFLQDEIAVLQDTTWLTVGVKVEHNDNTGFEIQPNIRLLWAPANASQSLWASAARSIRTPSRFETSGKIVTTVIPPQPPLMPDPVPVTIAGSDDFDSEELIAYELGYRFNPIDNFYFDLALFVHDYSNLQSYKSVTPGLVFSNSMYGESYGLEFTTRWTPVGWLDTELSYSFIQLTMDDPQNHQFSPADNVEGSSPRHQISFRTHCKLTENLNFNLWVRYVDELKKSSFSLTNNRSINDYINIDANIRWIIKEGVELSLIGQNLVDSKRVEFMPESFVSPIEIDRSVYAKLTWEF